MTASSVPPLIPGTVVGTGATAGPVRQARRTLPLAGLSPEGERSTSVAYALSAVDKSGRLADRSIVRGLGWLPGTRFDARERAGVIVAWAAVDGVCRVDDRGHLILPLAVRRWCRLAAGDRVLLAADHADGVLVAYPLGMLDRLLDGVRAVVAGGEAG